MDEDSFPSYIELVNFLYKHARSMQGKHHTVLHAEEWKRLILSAVEKPKTLLHERNVEQVRVVDKDQKPGLLSECKLKDLGCIFTGANDSNKQGLLLTALINVRKAVEILSRAGKCWIAEVRDS
ncbi:hypothetical protein AVEN_172880-1 [Araneus ventricosus]|uniref:Uncharacterized protein n=1 Tax=Araneus ventricosus TaxID=182803 RepID=A0A4Y2RTJ1_ARAVE|nr:hypothetical protein AVEN_172880-1 [Araneus ventricosus]